MKTIILIAVLLASVTMAKAQTNEQAKSSTVAKQDTTIEELEPVDEPAEYPGGMDAFLTYISRKLKYPPQARLDRINGKVTVSFVVEKNGATGNVKVVRSLTPETDAEAIRLIKASKTWKPAVLAGKPARQRFTQSITFSPPES